MHTLAMQKQNRVFNIADGRKNSQVRNSHNVRLQCEELGNVGLMAFGTYVSSSFDGTSALTEATEKVKFGKDAHVILTSGEHGLLARTATVSDCGKFALRNGKFIALGSHGTLHVKDCGTVAQFVAALAAGKHNASAHGFKVKKDGITLYGVGFGATSDWKAKGGVYASLAWVSGNGKLVFVDMETKKNAYNEKELGAHLCADKDALTKGEAAVHSFSGKTVTVATGGRAKNVKKGKNAKK